MGVGGGVGDWVGVSEGGGGVFYSKRASSPPKSKVLDEKCVYYFTQKDLPASQKTEIVLEK